MTDNEIIKAFKCCCVDTNPNCKKCPIEGTCANCDLDYEIYSLINRQKEKNENLKVDLAKCSIRLDNLYKTADEIKSEAIKEFVEKLKERLNNLEYHENSDRKTVTKTKLYNVVNWIMHEVVPDEIDNLVKEMTE